MDETAMNIRVDWMCRRHLPRMIAIEKECFDNPWTFDDFVRSLTQRNCIGMVAKCEEEIVGYMIYEMHRSRLHLLTIAVEPDFQDIGIGTRLIQKLLGKLTYERRNRIMLEVRESNLKAQVFFRGMGFRCISIIKDFYHDCDEDAYLMQFRLNEPTEIVNRQFERAYQYDQQEWK